MITVFVNNPGPYILLVDKAGDAYTTFISPDNRSPVLVLDTDTAAELMDQFAALVTDVALGEPADALIDVSKTGMSTATPGIGRLAEIQRFQGHFILVAADHAASLHVTDVELVAIFRGIERITVSPA